MREGGSDRLLTEGGMGNGGSLRPGWYSMISVLLSYQRMCC